MDCDIPRWLKNDLGLVQMSECDLNSLMFHPRYGGMCRRLIKFLSESTLCQERYPNVYAKEEALKASQDLETAHEKLYELSLDLEDVDSMCKETNNELTFLNAKLKHLQEIRELQKTSLSALEKVANRPNLGIEQMYRNNQSLDYLNDTSLKHVYTIVDTSELDFINCTHLAATDAELTSIKEEINAVHTSLSSLFQSINKQIQGNVQPIKANPQDLVALRLPDFGTLPVEINEDEKRLKDMNINLSKQVYEFDQQVAELSRQYKDRKNEILKNGKEELYKCLDRLENLADFVDMVDKYPSSIEI